MERKYTEKEFIEKEFQFLERLSEVQEKFQKWFEENLGYYKGGGRPTLRDMTNVYYDHDVITVNVGIKDLPTEIGLEIASLKNDIFNK